MTFTIGHLKFDWNQLQNTVRVYLNGAGFTGDIELRHCDTESLVRQWCKSMAIAWSAEQSRAIAAFDTKEPQIRDRHL